MSENDKDMLSQQVEIINCCKCLIKLSGPIIFFNYSRNMIKAFETKT